MDKRFTIPPTTVFDSSSSDSSSDSPPSKNIIFSDFLQPYLQKNGIGAKYSGVPSTPNVFTILLNNIVTSLAVKDKF